MGEFSAPPPDGRGPPGLPRGSPQGFSAQLVGQGHTLDVFACALDQVGLAEMRPTIERTGGSVVLAESFQHEVFRNSLIRMLSSEGEESLGLASSATFEVIPSRDVKVSGVIGPVASMDKQGPVRRRARPCRRQPSARSFRGLRRSEAGPTRCFASPAGTALH